LKCCLHCRNAAIRHLLLFSSHDCVTYSLLTILLGICTVNYLSHYITIYISFCYIIKERMGGKAAKKSSKKSAKSPSSKTPKKSNKASAKAASSPMSVDGSGSDSDGSGGGSGSDGGSAKKQQSKKVTYI
jgi:hypothetical protein